MTPLIWGFRAVLGGFWLWAGLSKWFYGFDATAFLQGALGNPAVQAAPYAGLTVAVIEWLIKTGMPVVNAAIPLLEVALGVWFVSGKVLRGAALGQAGMSLMFVVCGAISWNPLLLASSCVLLALPLPKKP